MLMFSTSTDLILRIYAPHQKWDWKGEPASTTNNSFGEKRNLEGWCENVRLKRLPRKTFCNITLIGLSNVFHIWSGSSWKHYTMKDHLHALSHDDETIRCTNVSQWQEIKVYLEKEDYWKVLSLILVQNKYASSFRPGWQQVNWVFWLHFLGPAIWLFFKLEFVGLFCDSGRETGGHISAWCFVFFFVMTRIQGAVWVTTNRLTVARVWAFMHGSVYRPIVSCPLCRGKSALKRCSATPSETSAPEKPISQIISAEI